MWKDAVIIVQLVLPNSPAEQKNRRLCDDPDACHPQLLRGDIIQCVNGRDDREGMRKCTMNYVLDVCKSK